MLTVSFGLKTSTPRYALRACKFEGLENVAKVVRYLRMELLDKELKSDCRTRGKIQIDWERREGVVSGSVALIIRGLSATGRR
jgi:hypothetical protein